MGRNKTLPVEIQEVVLNMIKMKMPVSEICTATGYKKIAIYEIKSRKTVKAPAARSGRKHKLSKKAKKFIIDLALKRNYNAKKIQVEYFNEVSYKTINRVLKLDAKLVYRKRKRSPNLIDEKKERRIKFAQLHADWKEECKNVIFSDEKRFKLHAVLLALSRQRT